MPNASAGVEVVATMVARSDRRALSEAWYSALHLAQHTPVARRAVPQPTPARSAARLSLSRACTDAIAPSQSAPAGVRARANDTRVRPGEAAVERRRPACETSARVERALTSLAARRFGHAAHTIDVAGGRVRLLVRTDRMSTRIVAVCSAPLREPVERALAQARFALARDGYAVGAP